MPSKNQFQPTNAWSQRTGYVRLADILAPAGPLPISKSSWWAGVREGRYPAAVKLGPRITAWKVEDILLLMERGFPQGGERRAS
jgi:prophage regulatory protein